MIIRKKAKDYYFPVGKGIANAIIEFTQDHLDMHLKVFNKETKPEYFGDLHDLGIDYKETVLMEADDINKVLLSGSEQPFRKGTNKKYNKIKDDMLARGFDVREKPIQIIIDKDGNILYVFNGNTTNRVLNKFTNVQNRLVAIYVMNDNFSKKNLILIGANQNSLEKESGINSLDDIGDILEEIKRVGGFKISKTYTVRERELFVRDVKQCIDIAGNGRFNLDTKKINSFVNNLIEEISQSKRIYSVDNGTEVMEELNGTYANTATLKYASLAAFPDKIHPHFTKTFLSFKKDYDEGMTRIKPENMSYEVIIHMGDPDPLNPVGDFFAKYTNFYIELAKIEKFLMEQYYNATGKKGNFKVIGAFQQVKEVEELDPEKFPFGQVVSFDDIMAYYNINMKVTP